MSLENIASPIAIPTQSPRTAEGIPDIEHLFFDQWVLRLTLRFLKDDNEPLYVCFNSVVGFRALPEGDLLEFWNPSTRPSGWLWKVKEGGWADLEKQRAGFVSGITRNVEEYLLLGQEYCLSVLARDEPEFSSPP